MTYSTLRKKKILTRKQKIHISLLSLLLLAEEAEREEEKRMRKLAYEVGPTVPRIRKHIFDVFDQLGDQRTKQAYRMERECFKHLFLKLKPFIIQGSKTKRDPNTIYLRKERSNVGARNGLIAPSTRFALAIRYFAGGSHYDLAPLMGLSVSDSYDSVNIVIDAIHKCPEFNLKFPKTQEEQEKVAKEFEKRSEARFHQCVGSMDGMLIWTECPTELDAQYMECGAAKLFCGRKKKYGLNMQAVCDANCRFTHVSINHPGSASDYLAWIHKNQLYKWLESDDNPLQFGYFLFADAAYINTHYLTTSYKIPLEEEDNCNFYHSQLQITIE